MVKLMLPKLLQEQLTNQYTLERYGIKHMKTPVVIKGSKSGITVVLDNTLEFDELKNHITEKFSSSASFLGEADIAIAFEGRELTTDEIDEILSIIKENTKLNIIYILDDNEERVEKFNQAVELLYNKSTVSVAEPTIPKFESEPVQDSFNQIFHKGNLRSGQSIVSEGDIVIMGDVNAGANVTAKGNIIIIGALLGTVHAGCDGNYKAFVIALDMRPTQIRIGEMIARSADKKTTKLLSKNKKPQIAYSSEGNIYIEEITREVIADIEI